MLKNHSNPVFNKVDTNKILKAHTNLDDVGKSLYRYNTLQEHHLDSQAQEEKQNIENNVLKTGISNNKYIWHSENGEKTCEVCASLDGKEFDFYDEVPERPHPNCRCYVEIVEDKEKCNCWDKINKIYEDTIILDNDIHIVINEIANMQKDVIKWYNDTQQQIQIVNELYSKVQNMKPCGEDCIAVTGFAANISRDDDLFSKVKEIFKDNESAIQTLEIFDKNKKEMENDIERLHTDKYYHAKANCESAELGMIQALWAILWSLGKEVKDYYKKVVIDHQDAFKIFLDCMEDLYADILGLLKALDHGYCSEKVKEVEKIFRK